MKTLFILKVKKDKESYHFSEKFVEQANLIIDLRHQLFASEEEIEFYKTLGREVYTAGPSKN